MNGLSEMVFICEIEFQSKIALRAAERLQAESNDLDQIETWSCIQSFLVASGNVSKMLWPIKKEYKERGERLRVLLKLDNDNLLADRKFRNYFEHYDERIEDWFENQRSAVYTDLAMNPSLQTFGLSNSNRGYNTFNNTLIFRGEILDINEVLKVIEYILQNCRGYFLPQK